MDVDMDMDGDFEEGLSRPSDRQNKLQQTGGFDVGHYQNLQAALPNDPAQPAGYN